MRFPREFYIPKGSVKVADKQSTAVAYLYEKNGVPYALTFHGRAQKPDWHHRFRNAERRAQRVSEHFKTIRASAAYKAKRKAEQQQKPRTLKVGDVLRASWGYDQTNIDYYEVTKLIGEKSVEIRPIAGQTIEETGWMQGKCIPVKGEYTGEVMRRLVGYGDSVKVDSVRRAFLWDGKPDHWTSYA